MKSNVNVGMDTNTCNGVIYTRIQYWEDVWNLCIEPSPINVCYFLLLPLFICSMLFGLLETMPNSKRNSSFVNIHDFEMLKSFKVRVRPLNTPRILEVNWKPPKWNWIKINCDWVWVIMTYACGGIARDYEGLLEFLLTFWVSWTLSLSYSSVLCQQLSSRMRRIDTIYG